MVGTVLLLAGYGGYAWWVARKPRRSSVALPFGLIAAACLNIEVWAGGPVLLGPTAEQATGGLISAAAPADSPCDTLDRRCVRTS